MLSPMHHPSAFSRLGDTLGAKTFERLFALGTDGEHLVYPLGSTLVIRSISDPTHKEFLSGHTDKIMSVAVSKSGRYIATGQRTHMGYQVMSTNKDACTLTHHSNTHTHTHAHKDLVFALWFRT